MVSTERTVESAQQLRMRRFAMSVVTYAFAILATYLVTRLGIGALSHAQWMILVGLCLFGISLFFILFSTKTNLRFSEPSLTREQIVYSALYGIVAMYWLPEARPIILLFFIPPFSFGMLCLTLHQYFMVVVCILGQYAVLLVIEYFQSPQGFKIQYQLFLFVLFAILLIWFAFFGGFISNIRRRLQAQKEEIKKINAEVENEIEERKRAQVEKDNLIIELKDALRTVKTLSGLLPICASCKKIRDDNGYWNQIETYIKTHSEAEFSHGLCPGCAKELYPDLKLGNKSD